MVNFRSKITYQGDEGRQLFRFVHEISRDLLKANPWDANGDGLGVFRASYLLSARTPFTLEIVREFFIFSLCLSFVCASKPRPGAVYHVR